MKTNKQKILTAVQVECCPGGSSNSQKGDEVRYEAKPKWTAGNISTASGEVLKASTQLTFEDVLGSWKARWGIKRMRFSIKPGVYGVGSPGTRSPVFVSANYKMSFDRLRRELAGLDAWIMVLDTKGINVWCSAGKGTFGTQEIVNRIEKVKLSKIVSHRTLILPQLSAPGVAAHEVTKRTRFKVIYGPVRAKDIPLFQKTGQKASLSMRRVKFTFFNRLALTPMEIVGVLKPLLIILGVLSVLNLIGLNLLTFEGFLPYLGAVAVGAVLMPMLLPWIPGRSFALKGWFLGMLWALAVNIHYGYIFSPSPSWKQSLVNFLVLPPLSSYLALNFTGSSTYTSLSGVVREMKIALPLIIASAGAGIVLIVVKLFVRF